MKTLYSLLWLCFLFTPIVVKSQKASPAVLISYTTFVNQEKVENNNPTLLLSSAEGFMKFSKNDLLKTNNDFPFEQTYYDNTTEEYTSIAQLDQQHRIATTIQNPYLEYTLHDQTKDILGLICHKATININSNAYTIWYTKELKSFGGPNLIGANLGVVLELDRNGNNTIVAESLDITPIVKTSEILQKQTLVFQDKASYDQALFESRFKTIKIFEDEQIHFDPEKYASIATHKAAHGTVIYKKVKFPTINEGEQVFLSVSQQSNGDAYDRTGSVFLIPTDQKVSLLDAFTNGVNQLPLYDNNTDIQYQGIVATNNYTPAIELMRFFTPFGIGHFNTTKFLDKTWQDQANYRQEISEYATILTNKEWYIGVYIGNYDKGGHKISAELTIHPRSTNVKNYTTIIPIFNTTNILEMAGQQYPTLFQAPKGLVVNFTLKEPMENATLRYVTTGHGGWSGGDEFNPKLNTIYLDEQQVISYYPWREDCGSYRSYNPVSGNFQNGLSSSDLSRSNWCPATITYPIWIPLGNLKTGSHTIRLTIDQGQAQGSSFSYWNTSGVIFGN